MVVPGPRSDRAAGPDPDNFDNFGHSRPSHPDNFDNFAAKGDGR